MGYLGACPKQNPPPAAATAAAAKPKASAPSRVPLAARGAGQRWEGLRWAFCRPVPETLSLSHF